MVSPVPSVVTLAQAKKHLRLTTFEDDDDVRLKLEQATSMVLDYVWRDDDDWVDTIVGWTSSTVPGAVKAAILVQFGELYRFRGDDGKETAPSRDPHTYLHPMAQGYLRLYRDPGMA